MCSLFPLFVVNEGNMKTNNLYSASCAAHGLDKIRPKLGSSVLMFGAGPTGVGFKC